MSRERHLRLVRADAEARPALVQVADQPDSYTVRRTGPVEAIVSRGRSGWLVMYGYVETDEDPWKASTHVPAELADVEAGAVALALAEAYDSGVPGWHELLAAAFSAGRPVLDLLRLHAPDTSIATGGSGMWASCAAESALVDYEPPYWLGCETVKILAASLGVTLESPPA